MTVQRPETHIRHEWIDDLVDQLTSQRHHTMLDLDLVHWRDDLYTRLERIHQNPEQGLGFIEETIRQSTMGLQRAMVQKAMQTKADAADEKCPNCQHPLREKKRRVPRTINAYCGYVQVFRTHGWCPRCTQWRFPADRLLGLLEGSNASPLVQEMSALLVSKMPAEQAEAISQRVLGRSLSRSSMARQAQDQGDRAIAIRRDLVQAPVVKAVFPSGADQPTKPFTLVIQIDAWNIRERDHWGETQARCARNEKPERWHWVYTATCFRLQHRCRKGRSKDTLRAIITERNYVATRGGIDELMQQLYYEARKCGLAHAERVLVIADGAVWIWNLANDRFNGAVQRLDLYHANTYVWAVANELHGAGTPAARQWVKPLLKQIRNDQVAKVITQLQELKPSMESATAEAADKTIEYYQKNEKRMKYKDARRRNEPQGSGAIESTCRQLQCRMKRCGQFWSTAGDEALLALEMFWRNNRWELLFPHAKLTGVANN